MGGRTALCSDLPTWCRKTELRTSALSHFLQCSDTTANSCVEGSSLIGFRFSTAILAMRFPASTQKRLCADAQFIVTDADWDFLFMTSVTSKGKARLLPGREP